MTVAASTVDLNADLGEGYPHDEALLAVVTSANVCCGVHAGSRALARETVRLGADLGVRLGAHPGYPDRARFGRASVAMTRVALRETLRRQVGDLAADAAAAGAALAYLKPHGALYHDSANDASVAASLLAVAEEFALALLHAPRFVRRFGGETPVTLVAEGFADRRYLADGTLAPRSTPGAVLTDLREVRAQTVTLLRGTGPAGAVESICVHGDTAGAVAIARAVRRAVAAEHLRVSAFAR